MKYDSRKISNFYFLLIRVWEEKIKKYQKT